MSVETPAGSRRPASIADVARVAEVSVPTVSRVLTGSATVSAPRRERVVQAIADLGYRPSATARALVSGRPTTIAVLSADTTTHGYSTTIRGIVTAARAAGYHVAIAVLDGSDDASLRGAVDAALGQALAGAILLKFDAAGVAALGALPDWLPVVVASGEPEADHPQALIDEEAGGRAIVQYLLDLGHATVHHVSVPPSPAEDGRTTGWRAALQAAGAEVPPVIPATWDARNGVEVGRALAARDDVTAVFCGNDEVAMGVIAGLTDAGRRVPEDVSVVGFDDHPLSAIWRPGITTVAQDFDDLGGRAFGLLARVLEGGPAPAPSVGTPTLVVRGSAAPPRSALRATRGR